MDTSSLRSSAAIEPPVLTLSMDDLETRDFEILVARARANVVSAFLVRSNAVLEMDSPLALELREYVAGRSTLERVRAAASGVAGFSADELSDTLADFERHADTLVEIGRRREAARTHARTAARFNGIVDGLAERFDRPASEEFSHLAPHEREELRKGWAEFVTHVNAWIVSMRGEIPAFESDFATNDESLRRNEGSFEALASMQPENDRRLRMQNAALAWLRSPLSAGTRERATTLLLPTAAEWEGEREFSALQIDPSACMRLVVSPDSVFPDWRETPELHDLVETLRKVRADEFVALAARAEIARRLSAVFDEDANTLESHLSALRRAEEEEETRRRESENRATEKARLLEERAEFERNALAEMASIQIPREGLVDARHDALEALPFFGKHYLNPKLVTEFDFNQFADFLQKQIDTGDAANPAKRLSAEDLVNVRSLEGDASEIHPPLVERLIAITKELCGDIEEDFRKASLAWYERSAALYPESRYLPRPVTKVDEEKVWTVHPVWFLWSRMTKSHDFHRPMTHTDGEPNVWFAYRAASYPQFLQMDTRMMKKGITIVKIWHQRVQFLADTYADAMRKAALPYIFFGLASDTKHIIPIAMLDQKIREMRRTLETTLADYDRRIAELEPAQATTQEDGSGTNASARRGSNGRKSKFVKNGSRGTTELTIRKHDRDLPYTSTGIKAETAKPRAPKPSGNDKKTKKR